MIFEELSNPISSEEADQHGLSGAKYSNSGEPKYKVDKSDERDLLTTGNLQALKDKFSL